MPKDRRFDCQRSRLPQHVNLGRTTGITCKLKLTMIGDRQLVGSLMAFVMEKSSIENIC